MDAREQKAIRKNRVELVKRLRIDDEFLSVLHEKKTLTQSMLEEIESQATRMKKAGLILDLLNRRGKKAYSELLRALDLTNQDELAQGLRQVHGGEVPNSSPINLREVSNQLMPMEEDLDALVRNNHMSCDKEIIKRNIPDYEKKSRQKNPQAHEVKRGRLFVIDNRNFNGIPDPSFPAIHLEDRLYSAVDNSNLNIMEEFHFETKTEENVEEKRITEVLDEEIDFIKENQKEIDCYILAVLSYGTEHDITMVDGKRLNPERITERFSGENLPELATKPKIFIIHTEHVSTETVEQEMETTDGGEAFDTISKTETDAAVTGKPIFPPKAPEPPRKIHPEANNLIITSKAYINEEKQHEVPWYNEGCMFIRLLTYVITKYAHIEHFKDLVQRAHAMLEEVHRKFAKKNSRLYHLTKEDSLTKQPYLYARPENCDNFC